MTTLAPAPYAARAVPTPFGRRIWNVVRLHFTNPSTVIVAPLVILVAIFAVNLAIWVIVARATGGDAQAIDNASTGMQFSGGGLYMFVYMLVVAVQAMNFTFSLAVGFGATRRDFYLGSGLTFLLLSAAYSAIYTVLGSIEMATDGWGLGGTMFAAVYFGSGGVERFLSTFVLFAFFFAIGSVAGAAYVRWKQYGVIGFFAVLAVILVGGAALFTFTDGWVAFGEFFVTIGFGGAYALLLLPTAIAALVGYLTLRRATPRS